MNFLKPLRLLVQGIEIEPDKDPPMDKLEMQARIQEMQDKLTKLQDSNTKLLERLEDLETQIKSNLKSLTYTANSIMEFERF